MIKLRDEKLIDKIMEGLNMDGLIDNTLHDQTMARNIIQRHLTHPTDEGIEPLNENIIQLYDSVRFGTAGDNVDEFIRHVYMKLGNHFTNVEGIEKEEPTVPDIILLGKDDISDDDMGCEIYGWVSDGKAIITGVIYKPKEVKPPTKDTIEKIGDFKDLYSFPNNPRVGQTCAGYIWNGEHRLEQGFDYMKFECLRTKYNELVDTVNHQQKQIQQLLSGK